jgi:hypothetical protein
MKRKSKVQIVKPDQFIQPASTTISLLRAAAALYQFYTKSRAKNGSAPVQKPEGVAIHRLNFRGKLIFSHRPILLPDECFFPIEEIEKLTVISQDHNQLEPIQPKPQYVRTLAVEPMADKTARNQVRML